MTEFQSVIELAQKAEQDVDLREALHRCRSTDEVVRLAAEAGVTMSTDELKAFGDHVKKVQQRAADGELSEAELETVAGGWVVTGLLTAGIIGLTGAGVAAGGAAVRAIASKFQPVF